jgi:hypothetical protein
MPQLQHIYGFCNILCASLFLLVFYLCQFRFPLKGVGANPQMTYRLEIISTINMGVYDSIPFQCLVSLSDDGLIPNCPNYFRIPGLDSRSPRPLAPRNYLAEFWSIWCLRLELPLAIFYQRSIKISCSLRYYRYYFHFPTFTWSDAFPHKPQCANFGVCGLSISFPTPTLDINGVI